MNMQKFFIKYRDRWWSALIGLFLVWLLNKLLDKTFSKIDTGYILDKIIYFLNYKVSILAVFLGVATYSLIFRVYLRIKAGKRNFKILHAIYGINNLWINITSELNNSVLENQLNIILSNNIAGDPAPGIRKVGIISYEYNGQKFQNNFTEGQAINLPN